MKYSGIGGQAVMEGVMMKNGRDYAVAVRTPSGKIEINKDKTKGNRETVNKIPLVRGVVAFVDSLVLGISTLMLSASYYEEEFTGEKAEDAATEDAVDVEKAEVSQADTAQSAEKAEESQEGAAQSAEKEDATDEVVVHDRTLEDDKADGKEKKGQAIEIVVTVMISTVVALALFLLLPYAVSKLLTNWIGYPSLLALIEGVVRVGVFILYVFAISHMPDIKRVFMYHGAEHKCINCIEHGLELNVENVKSSTRFHKRCGTSFLVIVLIISIIVFMFIRFDNNFIQLGCRLLLVPVIAGISYEFLRLAGRYDNWFVNALSKPGIWVQHLTTVEPEEEMIEVGIKSVEAVFDWKKFLEDYE